MTTYTYFITGTKFRGAIAQQALANMTAVKLEPEDNPHDKNAVAAYARHTVGWIFKKDVWTPVGYVRKDSAKNMREALAAGQVEIVGAQVVVGEDNLLHVNVEVAFAD
jgi:hypothetical protein